MNEAVPSRKERRKAEITRRRIAGFQEHFSAYGESHMFLAFHAAFPLILTPDLVYRIWVNFDRDEYDRLLDVPWIATADLLLSELCREVGYELYEMIPEVRQELLERFNRHPRFAGPANGDQTPRLDDLARFLQEYSKHLRRDIGDANAQALADVHLWTALSHSDPTRAVKEMLQALDIGMRADSEAEMLRMADLTAELMPLQETYRPLRVYLKGVEEFAIGNHRLAAEQLAQVDEDHFLALGIELPKLAMPEEEEQASETPPVVWQVEDSRDYQYEMARLLRDNFTLDEFKELCVDLSLEYSKLLGANKAEKMLELVLLLGQENRLDVLHEVVGKLRPDVDWPAPVDLTQLEGYQIEVARKLRYNFNTIELSEFSTQLGVNFDDLEGTVKADKALALVLHLDSEGRLGELLQIVRGERPQVVWPGPTSHGDDLNYHVSIARMLTDNFTTARLGELCLKLNLQYEALPGKRKTDTTRALVQGLAQEDRLDELQKIVAEMEPTAVWPDRPGAAVDQEAIGIRYVTAESGLNMRSGPGTTFEVLRVLTQGTAVEVLEEGEWATIRLDEQTGFVAPQFLAENPPDETPVNGQIQQPYLGPRPFTFDDASLFFGREKEIARLVSEVEQQRLVIVYGPAGAGKTSLVSAGLAPRLKEDGYQILPIARVSYPEPASTEPKNVFMSGVLLSLKPSATPYEVESASLSEFLRVGYFGPDRDRDQGAKGLVLIIDRVEEIVLNTIEWGRHREEFFAQVAEAMDTDPSLRIVLIVQEDQLDSLDRFWSESPAFNRSSQVKVERPDPEAARQAITRAAEMSGRRFEPEAAAALVEQLVETRGPDGSSTRPFVEPLTLQIVCTQLWQNLAPEQSVITLEDVRSLGDASQALVGYYEQAVHEAASENNILESSIRSWFETELLTPEGTRNIVYRGEADTQGLPNAAVDQLVSIRILRRFARSAGEWIELAHELLIEPILRSNQAWHAGQESSGQETPAGARDGLNGLEALVQNVRQGQCLPVMSEAFLSGYNLIDPSRGEPLLEDRLLAQRLAENTEYPFAERDDLSQVAQFLQVEADEPGYFAFSYLDFVKNHLLDVAGEDTTISPSLIDDLRQKVEDSTVSQIARSLGWFAQNSDEADPLRLIAAWPLPVFVTTSYHTFLESALETAGKKPQSDYCRWSDRLDPSVSLGTRTAGSRLSQGEPLVYHLFGVDSVPESLVLSEDDYLEWMMALSADDELLPEVIRRALTGAAILFLDYDPDSLAFKVLYQTLFAELEGPARYHRILTASDGSSQTKGRPDPAYVEKYLSRSRFDLYGRSGRDLVAEVQNSLSEEQANRYKS